MICTCVDDIFACMLAPKDHPQMDLSSVVQQPTRLFVDMADFLIICNLVLALHSHCLLHAEGESSLP